MVIHAAAHSHAFKAIVSEGASGQSFRDGRANRGTSSLFLGGGAATLGTAVFTNTLPPPSLKSEVAKIAPTAVFFIYGEHGQGGTETTPNESFFAARARAEADLGGPGRQHIAGITTEPAEYARRVIGFFDRSLVEPERRR